MNEQEIKTKLKSVANAFHAAFCDASEAELRAILDHAKNLSPTNCWFVTFYLKPSIISLIEARLIDIELERKHKATV